MNNPLIFPPSLPAGTVGASQSASGNSVSSPLNVEATEPLLHSFFVDYDNETSVLDAANPIAISPTCSNSLRLDGLEKELRNAVFNELLNSNSGFRFPPNAQVQGEGQFDYTEQTIGQVLPQISSFIVPDSRESIMKKLENGLLVTSASTPDMIVLNPLRTQQFYEMVPGEFKHGAAYTMNMAATQCFAYLYHFL